MKIKQQYSVITTKDGSPTLRLKTSSNEESMHSHGGAFSETIYIYSPPFKELPQGINRSVLSVGLGLGYNEIMSICELIINQQLNSFYIESYEKDEFLIQEFSSWVMKSPSSLTPVYEQMIDLFSEHYNIKPNNIKQNLKTALIENKMVLKKSIGFTTVFPKKFNIVLFDAFCSRTSPELWQDSFIQYVIDHMSTKKSYFTTYACKSNLNKLLNQNHFIIVNKAGFAGKRESTLAYRS